jgi:hypothetical protein
MRMAARVAPLAGDSSTQEFDWVGEKEEEV